MSIPYAGPVDYLVFSFPPGAVADDGFRLLYDLVTAGIIDILDLEVIGRNPDGSGASLPFSHLPITDPELASIFDGAQSRILDTDDLDAVASSLPEGGVGVAIVYEERSLADVAGSWDAIGGQLLLAGGVEPEELNEALIRTETPTEEN